MKGRLKFYVSALPFSVGVMLCLLAISFLVSFTDSANFSELRDEDIENVIVFFLLSIVGIPTLLLGINSLSSGEDL